MTKIYRTTDNNYVALVAHNHDLRGAKGSCYFGAFEYSIGQEPYAWGEWDLHIFDIVAEESLDVSNLIGIDSEVVSELVKASRGEVECVDIMGSDYYERSESYLDILEDDVLLEAIAAEYAEKEED